MTSRPEKLIRYGSLAAAVALGFACSSGSEPEGSTAASVPVFVDLTGAPAVDHVVVEVTGEGITASLVFTLPASDGQAADTLAIPAGAARTLTIRAFDASDIETHRGTVVLDIHEGVNPGVTLTLTPLTGSQPITVHVGDVFVTVDPAVATLPEGKTVQLTAHVRDAAGTAVDLPVQWGSFDPTVARVDSAGLVTTLTVGSVKIAAVAGGAAGSASITVVALSELIDGSLGLAYTSWLRVLQYEGPTLALSAAAFEHGTPWSNAGTEYYSRIPRVATVNVATDPNIQNITTAWNDAYLAMSKVQDAFTFMGGDTAGFGAQGRRAEVYGRYVWGLALGTLALLYDSAYVPAEFPAVDTQQLHPYAEVMTAALAYLADAAAAAPSLTNTIPASWMGQEVSGAQLARLAHSYRARFRAAVARMPAERQAADWSAIRADVNAGITADWDLVFDCNVGTMCSPSDLAFFYRMLDGWQMQANWVAGMADTSGAYQAWMASATVDKQPFIILTPDTRWPRGATDSAQRAQPGEYFTFQANDNGTWARPDRGTWRWSYYGQTYPPFYAAAAAAAGTIPLMTVEEMQALVAEADYYGGNPGAVAAFVNATRTLHGLQATDAGGANADCVPRLPNGNCASLWEMLKWEKRLETQFAGPLQIGWYFDGRGWGDLMEGTPLQLPVPYLVMQLRGQAPYNFGGVGGTWAAPVGTYGY